MPSNAGNGWAKKYWEARPSKKPPKRSQPNRPASTDDRPRAGPKRASNSSDFGPPLRGGRARRRPRRLARAGFLPSVVSTDRAEVHVRVPENIVQHISVGDTVTIDGQPVAVLARVPTLDAETRTALVRLEAPPRAIVGEALDVTVPVEWTGRGVKVPRDALIADPEQARLVRVIDGKADVVPVEVLVSTRTDALVQADGLSVGDVVVVRGNERVRPGQEVRIEGDDGV